MTAGRHGAKRVITSLSMVSILKARLLKLLQWLAHRQHLIPSGEVDTITEREADKMILSGPTL